MGLPPTGPGSLSEPARRLAARFLDSLFFIPVWSALLALALLLFAPHYGPMFPKTPPCPADVAPRACPTNTTFPGFLWLYFTVFGVALVAAVVYLLLDAFLTARNGRTPGKAVMGIRPVRPNGAPLGFLRALGRSAATAAAGALSWIGLLDSLWCLWDDNSQCIHDKIADTVVINDR